MNTETLIQERGKTHGSFVTNSDIADRVMQIYAETPQWYKVPSFVRIAVFFIVHKMARALCGNAMFDDHWKDVQGYAKLVEEQCHIEPHKTACPHCFGVIPPTVPNGLCPLCGINLMTTFK